MKSLTFAILLLSIVLNVNGQTLEPNNFFEFDFEFTRIVERCQECDSIADIDQWMSGQLGAVDFSAYVFDPIFISEREVEYDQGVWEMVSVYDAEFETTTITDFYEISDQAYSYLSWQGHEITLVDFDEELGYSYTTELTEGADFEQEQVQIPFGLELGNTTTTYYEQNYSFQFTHTYVYPNDTVIEEEYFSESNFKEYDITFLSLIDVIEEDGIAEDIVVLKREQIEQDDMGNDFASFTSYNLFKMDHLMFPCYSVYSISSDDIYTIARHTYEGFDIHPLNLTLNESPIQFSIHPNPTNGTLNVQKDSDVIIALHDVSGRLLQKFEDTGRRIAIDTSNLDPGIYLLIDSSGSSKRFVKR